MEDSENISLRRQAWEAMGDIAPACIWSPAPEIGRILNITSPHGNWKGSCGFAGNGVTLACYQCRRPIVVTEPHFDLPQLPTLPPIESDVGIAVKAILEFCAKETLVVDMRIGPTGHTACALKRPSEANFIVDCYGVTPAEAICNALIAASKTSTLK